MRILPVDYWVDCGVEERKEFCHLGEVKKGCAELEKQMFEALNASSSIYSMIYDKDKSSRMQYLCVIGPRRGPLDQIKSEPWTPAENKDKYDHQ